MGSFDRLRQLLGRKSPSSSSSQNNQSSNSTTSSTAAVATSYSRSSRRRATAPAPSNSRQSRQASQGMETAHNRTRLPRGWWPGESEGARQTRGQLKLKAMDDLKDETFVVTEDHIEWIFDDDEDFNEKQSVEEKTNRSRDHYEDTGNELNEENNGLDKTPSTAEDLSNTFNNYSDMMIEYEPQCHLILPMEITKHYPTHNNGRTSGECAICMLDYDIGQVVVCSKRCSHAFHQDCILNWFSRAKTQCPSCREIFWDPNDEYKDGKKKNSLGDNSGSHADHVGLLGGNRARADTDDTDVLSVMGSDSRGNNQSFDGDGIDGNGITLEPVIEHIERESSTAAAAVQEVIASA